MKMSFGLEINQSQKMILTKELKQSLEILQMNRFEIEELIVRETNENPTLEVEKKRRDRLGEIFKKSKRLFI